MHLDSDDCLINSTSVFCSHEPGFRDLYLQVVGHDGQRIRTVELLIAPADALGIFAHVLSLNSEAWADGGRPNDAEAGECRPCWLEPCG